MSMSSDPILTEQQIEQLKNQQGGIEFGLGRRGSIDLNPAASAILGTITVDPIATLRDRILRQQGIIEEQTRGTNIDPAQYLKELEDALAAAGLDQQGNPIQPEDPSINPLTVNPLLAQDAVNTGPFVEDNDPNQKAIDAFIDLISGKYKKDKNDITPIDVAGVGTILAGQGSDNQAGTPTGGTPQGQIGTPQGETSTPQGSTPIPQGGTPQGGTPTSDTAAVDSPIGTPTVSTGSVLDQTETVNVNVDDQPKGFLTGMTPQARAIINEGNRSDITERMLGTFIAKQDVPIIPPLQFELKNVPQSDFAKALLTSDGLLRTLV